MARLHSISLVLADSGDFTRAEARMLDAVAAEPASSTAYCITPGLLDGIIDMFSGKVFKAVHERHNGYMKLTEAMFEKLALEFEPEIASLALKLCPQSVKFIVTEKIMWIAARTYQLPDFKLLLDIVGDQSQGKETGDVRTTADALSHSEINRTTVDMSENGINFTIPVLKEVAKNEKDGAGIMSLLLDLSEKHATPIEIMHDLLYAAADNESYEECIGVMEAFATHTGAIDIERRILQWAFSTKASADRVDVIKHLIRRFGEGVDDWDIILYAAVNNRPWGTKSTEILLASYSDKIVVTAAIVQVAMTNRDIGFKIVEMLHTSKGVRRDITQEEIEEIVREAKARKNSVNRLLSERMWRMPKLAVDQLEVR